MSEMVEMDQLMEQWGALGANSPRVRRLDSWAHQLADAARDSFRCGLTTQGQMLLGRLRLAWQQVSVQENLPTEKISFAVSWPTPENQNSDREENLWRRFRSSRASRRPYMGEDHPAARGMDFGPYNRQSAVAEALQGLAAKDPLWVDDVFERERALRSLDAMLLGKDQP